MNKLILSFLLICTINSSFKAQTNSIIGLWEAEKVTVGDQNMTPTAKWFKINSDSTYQTGNGWLQSSSGEWTYEAGIYTPSVFLDINNRYGGFRVSFQDEHMIWQREEDGMLVKVQLKKIKQLPMAPWDFLEGVWELEEMNKEGQAVSSEIDPKNNHRLFFRWDRMYVELPAEGGKIYGYWHLHAHKPLLTMIPQSNPEAIEKWNVQVGESQLILEGVSEMNKGFKRVYKRSNQL